MHNQRSGQTFLNGHTTDYLDKGERQQTICCRVNQLTQDIDELMNIVAEYAELYEAPAPLIDRLYDLGSALTDGAMAIDPSAKVAMADLMKHIQEVGDREAAMDWDLRNHYGKERGDF